MIDARFWYIDEKGVSYLPFSIVKQLLRATAIPDLKGISLYAMEKIKQQQLTKEDLLVIAGVERREARRLLKGVSKYKVNGEHGIKKRYGRTKGNVRRGFR